MFGIELPPDDQRGRNAIRVANVFAAITSVGICCMVIGEWSATPWLSHLGFFIVVPTAPIAVTGWCAGVSIAGATALGMEIPPMAPLPRRVLLVGLACVLAGFAGGGIGFLGDSMKNERIANAGIVILLIGGLGAFTSIAVKFVFVGAAAWRRWRSGEWN